MSRGSQNPYTDAQWAWIAERYREGYQIKDLAAFLGMSREHIRRHLAMLGAHPYAQDELDPLESRAVEFNALGSQEEEKP